MSFEGDQWIEFSPLRWVWIESLWESGFSPAHRWPISLQPNNFALAVFAFFFHNSFSPGPFRPFLHTASSGSLCYLLAPSLSVLCHFFMFLLVSVSYSHYWFLGNLLRLVVGLIFLFSILIGCDFRRFVSVYICVWFRWIVCLWMERFLFRLVERRLVESLS